MESACPESDPDGSSVKRANASRLGNEGIVEIRCRYRQSVSEQTAMTTVVIFDPIRSPLNFVNLGKFNLNSALFLANCCLADGKCWIENSKQISIGVLLTSRFTGHSTPARNRLAIDDGFFKSQFAPY